MKFQQHSFLPISCLHSSKPWKISLMQDQIQRKFAVFCIDSESAHLGANFYSVSPDVSWFIYEEGALREFPLRTSKLLMKRLHLVEKLKDAAVVGVLVGTLSVEGCLAAVDRVKSLCKSKGNSIDLSVPKFCFRVFHCRSQIRGLLP